MVHSWFMTVSTPFPDEWDPFARWRDILALLNTSKHLERILERVDTGPVLQSIASHLDSRHWEQITNNLDLSQPWRELMSRLDGNYWDRLSKQLSVSAAQGVAYSPLDMSIWRQRLISQLNVPNPLASRSAALDLEGVDWTAFEDFRDGFLAVANVEELATDVGQVSTEAELEEFGRSEPFADSFLEGFYRRAAHFTQELFPKYSAAAVDGINRALPR